MTLRRLPFLVALILAGCGDPVDPVTTVLPPADGGEAFEPTVAIDPVDPDRITVAAMYGVPFARGAKGIWIWRTRDGGRTWSDGPLDPPRLPGGEEKPGFAADVIAGFGKDGSALFASMSNTSSQGGTFLSRFLSDGTVTHTPVYLGSADSTTGTRILYDKPWMVVDHGPSSPRSGAIYLSIGAVTVGPGPAGPGVDWKPLRSQVLLRSSLDGGVSFGPTSLVGDSASFGGFLAVSGDGVLDVTWTRLANKDGGGDAVFHRRSTDGGVTFDSTVTVAAATGDTLLELPVVAARPDGSLLACWSQGDRRDERTNEVRCATHPPDGAWTAARGLGKAIPDGAVAAYPTVLGTGRAWYLLLYLVFPTRTEVALLRSDDGGAFDRVAVLATAEGLGPDRFCVTTATACRRTRTDGFAIGDYVSLDAQGGRITAAYVLPRPAGAGQGGAAIHVTTLPEPAATAR